MQQDKTITWIQHSKKNIKIFHFFNEVKISIIFEKKGRVALEPSRNKYEID